MKCDLAFLTLYLKTCMLLKSCILLKQGTNKIDNYLKQSSIFNFQDSAKKSRAKKDESLRHLKGTNAKLRKMSKELETTFKEIMEKRINLKNMEALYRRRLQRLRRILERKGTSRIKLE